MKIKKALIKREEPEFQVQKEYEGKFKSLYQKMILTLSKNILQKFTHNVVKQ
jgi:hypothetical protein